MSYNLKAKHKKTGKIQEYILKDNVYTFDVGKKYTVDFTQDEFNTLYEVISDKSYSCPLQVGTFGCACLNCKEEFTKVAEKWFPNTMTSTQEGWRNTLKVIVFNLGLDADIQKNFYRDVEYLIEQDVITQELARQREDIINLIKEK